MGFVISLKDLSFVVDHDVGVSYFLRIFLCHNVNSTKTQPDVIGHRQVSAFKLRNYFLCEARGD